MLISHEVPVSILGDSHKFNDYDYSLLHLMDIPEYKQYYIDNAPGRMQYMDNSAYEYQFIESGFDVDYFYEIINEVNPSHVIVPDVIGNKDATIAAFKTFEFSRIPEDTKIIGVVQGETYEELNECYDFMKPRCDVIAIAFHSKAYIDRFSKNSKDEANAIGRVKFIRELISAGKVDKNSLHLIGMSLPVELEMYSEEELIYITSIDTANPFQFAMTTGEYPSDIEDVTGKPKYIMDHAAINKAVSEEELKIFSKNAGRFRELQGR